MITVPYRFGEPLEAEAWARVKLRAMFECCKWDIQSEDHCVLSDFPLLLKTTEWDELTRIAERLSAEAIAAEEEILSRPELLEHIGLSAEVRRVLSNDTHNKDSTTVRVMRFDFHFTEEGWRISEVNADVPGGFNEGAGFTKVMAEHYPGHTAPPDIAKTYMLAVLDRCESEPTVAMVHATGYMDDRQVMEYLAKEIVRAGGKAVPCAPHHLRWRDGHPTLDASFHKGVVDAAVRFFPADWLPRLGSARNWAPYFVSNGFCLSNPGTAIVIQTKRWPLVWDELKTDLSEWRLRLPETHVVRRDADDTWVWKPAFGRVGEGIGIPGITPHVEMRAIKTAALREPQDWVIQKRFRAVAVEGSAKLFATIGVYTVNGRSSGIYGRVCKKALIDHTAQDVAVLLSEERG